MNITSKFIYAKTKSKFEQELINIPPGLNPIVFIEDTKELWTMGTYFSMGYPSIEIEEITGAVKVSIGNSNFLLETSGSSLSVKKGTGNTIVIGSTALSKVDTELPLIWDNILKKLLHNKSGVNSGSYGQSSDVENASIINIPNVTTDSYGHIIDISTSIVSIRDYVEQLAPNELLGNRNVLLSYNEANLNSDTAQVRKARGLIYNSLSQILSIGGGLNVEGPTNINNGDLTVIGGDIVGNLKGDVTGEATPKIHLSELPEYGGASLNLFGHVRLEDTLGINAPEQSSDNLDTSGSSISRGVAASPYMVWQVREEIKDTIANVPFLGGIDVGENSIEITEKDQRIEIQGNQGVSVTIRDNGIIIKGTEIKGYDENEQQKTLNDNIIFGKDFNVDADNELSIRWLVI